MGKDSVQYKRTVKGSVGAGMSALFNGSGRQYYILQHKDASRYHQIGESQKVIIDQVELGRSRECQVRFDDSWPTVSRRHAAIERDANGWKIIPMSQTNSTLVNGRSIYSPWYLQNGDEIQLSTDGPRLGFIVPQGSQSLVSSIKLTERLNLFREQALRPYKTAISILCAALVIACCAGGYGFYNSTQKIQNLQAINIDLKKSIRAKEIADSIERERIQNQMKEMEEKNKRLVDLLRQKELLYTKISEAKKDVYAIWTTLEIRMGDEVMTYNTIGTGFLLSDGRFVTARHCVQPWMYDMGFQMKAYAMSRTMKEVSVKAEIFAKSPTDEIRLSSDDFVVDTSFDIEFPFKTKVGSKTKEFTGTSACPIETTDGIVMGNSKMYGTDWAYAKVNKKGSLTANPKLSETLKAGQEVHVLGFPGGLGLFDGKQSVEPIYNVMRVSRDGLNDANCIMVSEGAAQGNSGGPVFAFVNGQLQVIAIVSRKETATQDSSISGVGLQQQQYDQLVPMSNLK